MITFPEPAVPARWLSPQPVPPDQPLHEASGEFAALLLAWLREGGDRTRLEWVVDAEAGGAVRTWLRCDGAAEHDISLLAAAAGEDLAVSDPPWLMPALFHSSGPASATTSQEHDGGPSFLIARPCG